MRFTERSMRRTVVILVNLKKAKSACASTHQLFQVSKIYHGLRGSRLTNAVPIVWTIKKWFSNPTQTDVLLENQFKFATVLTRRGSTDDPNLWHDLTTIETLRFEMGIIISSTSTFTH